MVEIAGQHQAAAQDPHQPLLRRDRHLPRRQARLRAARNRHGRPNEYFTCIGRRHKRTDCRRGATLVDRVEDRIEDAHATVSLTDDQVAGVRHVLHDVFATMEASSDDERATLAMQGAKLEAEQLKLVQPPTQGATWRMPRVTRDRIRTSTLTWS